MQVNSDPTVLPGYNVSLVASYNQGNKDFIDTNAYVALYAVPDYHGRFVQYGARLAIENALFAKCPGGQCS